MAVVWARKTLPTAPVKFTPPHHLKQYFTPTVVHLISTGLFLLFGQNIIYWFSQGLKTLFQASPVLKHGPLLRYLRRYLNLLVNKIIKVGGYDYKKSYLKLLFSGKVGVVGDSRKRKFRIRVGEGKIPNTLLKGRNESKHHFFLIRTSTGVVGVWIWFGGFR